MADSSESSKLIHARPGTPARMPNQRTFLFLQGPISPFFRRLAQKLESMGHQVIKLNLNLGDQLLWAHRQEISYRGSLKHWPDFILRIYREKQVTDILLLGEQRDYHRIAIDLARKQEISVAVTDFGYLRPDWITLEQNGMSAESEFPREPQAIYELADQCSDPEFACLFHDSFFNQAFWDVLYHFIAIFGAFLYPGYDNFRRHNPVQDYFGILIRLFRRRWVEPRAQRQVERLCCNRQPYFVYPLQLQHDYSIQAYSPYEGNEQPMQEILASFASSAPADCLLVIKIHPLDPNPFKWRRMMTAETRRLGIPQRVEFLDGGALDPLLAGSLGVVTINSTTGIGALQQGVPTKILGDAIYDVEGLISHQSLDEFWQNPMPPSQQLRDAFMKALAGSVQLKGTYYKQPGIDAAVDAASQRLDKQLVNQPL